jgi:hypothetical protein
MRSALHVHLIAAGRFHDIDFARLELLKLLAEHPRIRTSVASDWHGIEALSPGSLLITYTCDLVPDADQTGALRAFLAAGGRWLALHGSNAILRPAPDGKVDCPDEAPDYMALIGSQFLAHPPIAPFKVHVTDPDHPLTQGLRDFRIEDELFLLRCHEGLHTLLHTSFAGTCPEFRAESWDEAHIPVMYERREGAGAVLYLALGHCRGHYDLQPLAPFWPHPQRCAWNYPVYYQLLRRAIVWGLPQLA